jgi:hypothetical protein
MMEVGRLESSQADEAHFGLWVITSSREHHWAFLGISVTGISVVAGCQCRLTTHSSVRSCATAFQH